MARYRIEGPLNARVCFKYNWDSYHWDSIDCADVPHGPWFVGGNQNPVNEKFRHNNDLVIVKDGGSCGCTGTTVKSNAFELLYGNKYNF